MADLKNNIEVEQPNVTIVKSQSSIQIEIDSKGSKKYSVKIYDDNPEIAEKIALEISRRLDQEIGR